MAAAEATTTQRKNAGNADAAPMLSIVVPTYNEKGNMEPLLTGLAETLDAAGISFEVIVMDDNSPDGTAAEVERLRRGGLDRVRCVVRTGPRGLSPAVIDGYRECRGAVWLVMDADLSHPIEAVPRLYRRVADGGADICVGSRHCAGGGIADWPLHRRVISCGAALLARPLTPCTDPMAGFYAIRPAVIDGVELNAAGFKILLEILVKGTYRTLAEEPIVFRDREVGESKLSRGVMLAYVAHLVRLYLYPGSAPLVKFLFVGGCGTLLDLALFSLLMAAVFHHNDAWATVAQLVSFCCALAWNFAWNSRWTFSRPARAKDAPSPAQQRAARTAALAKYVVLNVVSFAFRTVVFRTLQRTLHVSRFPYLQLLLLAVILMATAINFVGSKLWAFKN